MRVILTILLVTISFSFLRAQDTTLPKGNCVVYLLSGKKVKDVRLWKIESGKLEYEKEGNLHDLPLSDINLVQTSAGDYTFSDSAAFYKIMYDRIILIGGDTIYCFIKEIGPLYIKYQSQGERQESSVERYNVKKHLLKGESDLTEISKPGEVKKETNAQTNYVAPTNYYKMGKADGIKEFQGNGSLAGGIVCGFIPIIGWGIGIGTLGISPNTNPTKTQLYTSNKEYCRGYERGAHLKKIRRTLIGTGIGAGFLFILLTL